MSQELFSDDGKLITCKDEFGKVYTMEWIEQAEAEHIQNKAQNDMDPAEAPQAITLSNLTRLENWFGCPGLLGLESLLQPEEWVKKKGLFTMRETAS